LDSIIEKYIEVKTRSFDPRDHNDDPSDTE
jgi:hypothetical protein